MNANDYFTIVCRKNQEAERHFYDNFLIFLLFSGNVNDVFIVLYKFLYKFVSIFCRHTKLFYKIFQKLLTAKKLRAIL